MTGVQRGLSACLALALLVVHAADTPARGAQSDLAAELQRLSAGRADLMALYAPGHYRPMWLGADLRPTGQSRDALRLLQHASDDGLAPSDYATADLQARALAIAADGPSGNVGLAEFDAALSRAALRYMTDLSVGRVDSSRAGFEPAASSSDRLDMPALLRDALARGQLVVVARSPVPRAAQYRALATELSRHRTLAAHPWPPLMPVERSVHPNEPYAGTSEVWRRLVLLGDAPADLAAPSDSNYAGSIVEAVRRFQRRHGLDPDGVIGRLTLAALAVTPAQRARQIELAMERQRWLPRDPAGRLIVVNIPMFRLLAWDTQPSSGAARFTTDVIVGRAAKTETPEFSARLVEVIFRPAWNVPLSIVRKEIIPALRRDPAYLQRHDMELVTGYGNAERTVSPTPDVFALLRSGGVRIRQRPGPANSLGLVRLSLPNPHDVYIHATPAQALFALSRRDLSHGCVRAKDPVGLAEWVLAAEEGWDRARVEGAMHADVSSRVPLRESILVVFVYSTAEVELDTGSMIFAEDVYGRDAQLDAALRSR